MSDKPFILPNEIIFAELEDRIARGESMTIPLSGYSMEPLIKTGMLVTIAPLLRPIHVGDVVLFRYHGQHILHRVVNLEKGKVTTQGDNCISTEVFPYDDIVGRLTHVSPRKGVVLNCDGTCWRCLSLLSIVRRRIHVLAVRCLNKKKRQWMSPLYFFLLLALMWAPLGPLGAPLNNFLLGIRLDHLVHASVYLPCAFFLMDWLGKSGRLWIVAIAIALLTESVQYLLPYRGFDINDLVANFLGVTMGWLVVFLHFRRRVVS